MKKFYKNSFLLLATMLLANKSFSQVVLVQAGAAWKYLANGSNQITAWREVAFNDAAWLSGNAQLGYGDGDEATVVPGGSNPNNRYVTTYFRKTVSIANAASFSNFALTVKRDDGIVLYVNGVEKYRNNMPTGTVSYTTLASTAASDDGGTWQAATLPAGTFITGTNVIAVEIHQNSISSSDISFDLQLTGTVVPVQTTLVSAGASWKYLANGSNQVVAWRELAFNDAAWLSGNAQLGYGDGDEATVVPGGGNPSARYITTYFRKSISVPNPSAFSSYVLNVKRDDGIVVYVNGAERYRNNMPSGTISYTTLASTAASDDGGTWQTATLPAGIFITGTNVIAVEIHQNSGSSTDISFDLELKTNPVTPTTVATLTRGPYLQMGTPGSVIVRWRSDLATNSKVSYGLSAANLSSVVNNTSVVTDHVIQLSGLTANTKYFYAIGSSSQTLQGDTSNYFITAPAAGTQKKTKVWVNGDCGNNSTNQKNVRDQYLNYMGTNYTDVWLLLGDNAYNGGLDNEYQTTFFDIYKTKLLKQTVLWPSPGNHDYNSNASRVNDHAIPYYDIFSLPTTAQAGGVASNTEAFYSFNYSNIHFISLDSYGKEANTYKLYDTLGPQVLWLKQDLAANTQKWTIVYWHHPPYSMGSHNSDSEADLTSIRQNLLKILERYKVDLVLCGHSHGYERSKLIQGHYGNEASFNAATHNISSSSGKYDGSAASCPYVKNTSTSYNGAVYVVAGSAGQLSSTAQASWPHAAMYYSNNTTGGSLALEIDANRLDAKFVCADGTVKDNFTLVKDVNTKKNVSLVTGSSTTLAASWIGNYSWTGGAVTRSITVSPTVNTNYIVKDPVNCLADTFIVTVTTALARAAKTWPATVSKNSEGIRIYPNPASGETIIEYSIPAAGNTSLEIFDMAGKKMRTLVNGKKNMGVYTYTYFLNTSNGYLQPGIYTVKLSAAGKESAAKLIVTGK